MKATDHLGKSYNSVKEMCEAYNVRPALYGQRRRRGYTVQEALVGRRLTKEESPNGTYYARPLNGQKVCKDHLGNEFPSIKVMCEYYNVSPSVYCRRIKAGSPIDVALLGKRKASGRIVTDHLGNTYDSVSEMCRAYNVNPTKTLGRLKSGWSVEDALTKASRKGIRDHLGNEYRTMQEMCNQYGIDQSTYYRRVKEGYTLEEALTYNSGKKK